MPFQRNDKQCLEIYTTTELCRDKNNDVFRLNDAKRARKTNKIFILDAPINTAKAQFNDDVFFGYMNTKLKEITQFAQGL